MKKRLNVIGNNVLIKILTPIYEGKIIFPETFKQKLIYGIVISRGNDVNDSIQNESLVIVSWTATRTVLGKDYCDNEELIVINQHDILMVKIQKAFKPFGKNALISRLNTDSKQGQIIIHNLTNIKIQTLYGVIKTLGVFDMKEIECNAGPGDSVKIDKWTQEIKEIEIYGDYCLIVPIKQLQFKINDPSSVIPI